MNRIYQPTWLHCLVVPLGITVVIGLPFARTWGTWFALSVVFVVLVVFFRRFLRATETDTEYACRSPETFRRVNLRKENVDSAEGRFPLGGPPGRILRDLRSGEVGFLPGTSDDRGANRT